MSSETLPLAALIEMDRLDQEAFAAAVRRLTALRETLESGLRLVPQFDGLGRDVFAVLYKYNVVRLRAPAGTPPEMFRQRVLDWVLAAPGLERSKEATRLDTIRAGLATHGVLTRVLEVVRNPEWFSPDDLLQQWRLDQLTQRQQDLADQMAVAKELEESGTIEDEEAEEALSAVRDGLDEEARDVRRQMQALAKTQARELDRLPARAESSVCDAVDTGADRLKAAETAATTLGAGLGAGVQGTPTADMMALGEQLLSNPKLRQLAELVGLFKQVARAARKRVFERAPKAIHSIDRGSDLSRLLASELGALSHPVLRREFLRRFVDGLLAEYAIEADLPAGRGPLVVCIDASGSMRGPREIWAKAIALTFLEIARRERRAFRAVVFSGGADDARCFELLESALDRRLRPPRVDPQLLVDFADYFPAGGTDFEAPLTLAMEALRESRFRRGDIVFITDGEASVSSAFLTEIQRLKQTLDFCIYGVLVDVQGGTPKVLEAIADDMLAVSELTAEALRPVFQKV